ncbi:MAG: hypothetical protein JWL60_758 [Gemmatimonadetes bacterium]|jgi:hypothetical protein|nr:hypothetical protein [Gemmatimonadota bacterium]
MNSRLLAVLLAGALAAVPAAASAQISTSFGVSGGLSMPQSDLKDIAESGYNVGAHLNVGMPLLPVGLRIEGAYNSFNAKSALSSTGKANILSGTVNATLGLGFPYVIGGIGMYQRKFTERNVADDTETAAGVNGGVGIRFPLGVMSTFVEARYHMMLGDEPKGANLKFIPITFGISF